MSKAKITRPEGYRCAPEGHTVVTIPCGTIVEGNVAEWALSDGAASRMFDPRDEAKVVSPPETKAVPKKHGRPQRKVVE